MKKFKWAYGALAVIASSVLIASFFMADVKPIAQLTLLVQSLGFGFISGMCVGAEL